MMEVLIQEIEDLRLFADPFEDFSYDLREGQGSEGWTTRLIRKGKNIRIVRDQDGEIVVHSGGRSQRHRDFKALLVSGIFADLERLAIAQQHQVRESVYDNVEGGPKRFIDSQIKVMMDGKDYRPLSSFDDVSELLNERDEDLRIIVIDGIAGVGKTLLIKRIVEQRSRPKSYKSGNPLLLHVESLGKVLTALNDRIAGALSDLRASFVEAELKPLIRRGLIQLAIDGFDELSDSRGYSRAWGALRDFLRELDGRGTCILAGRDTMLNENTLKEGLGSAIGNSRVFFLGLHEPQPEDIQNWLVRKPNWHKEGEAIKQIVDQAKNIDYIRRPFFISLISDTIGPEGFKNSGGEPIVDLMSKMVLRESEKLIPNDEHIGFEKVASLYTDVLAEVAQIMMDDETDSIEIGLLKLLVEEIFIEKLDKETVDAIKNRADTLAMLERGATGEEDRRKFPHEAIRSYFFAKSIIDYVPRFGRMNALYRNPLNTEDFRIFNRVVRNESPQNQHDLREQFVQILREESETCIISNLGGLILSILPLESDDIEGKPLVLTHKKLQNAWMGEHIDTQQAQLFDCHIGRLDVRGADISGIEFHDVTVDELFVDRFVKFGGTIPNNVRSLTLDLRHHHTGSTEYTKTLFKPVEIEEWMSSRQNLVEYMNLPTNGIYNLLEKLARVSMRQYWIRDTDHEATKLVQSEHWTPLCRLLEQHGRLKVKTNVPASGPSSRWFHLVDGREFLNVARGEGDVSPSPNTQEILKELGFSV